MRERQAVHRARDSQPWLIAAADFPKVQNKGFYGF
jgi:hypothetical protein